MDKKSKTRESWDSLYMGWAHDLAKKRSPDPKTKVACLIVNKDNTKVLSMGYNGDESGGKNERESLERGRSGFIHAEINALIKLDYSEKYKKLYITHSPCRECARALINGKINEIIYSEVYCQATLDWLKTHPKGKKIKIRQYQHT